MARRTHVDRHKPFLLDSESIFYLFHLNISILSACDAFLSPREVGTDHTVLLSLSWGRKAPRHLYGPLHRPIQ
jgi:hypothetical protein